jgi:ubiquinone/menaquinone biosynthesis C-methylase UbiE
MSAVEDYYAKDYASIQRDGIQGLGNRWMDRALIRRLVRGDPHQVLELGCSSGEFTSLAIQKLEASRYVGIDLAPGISSPELLASLRRDYLGTLEIIAADAEELPFDDNLFSLTFSTCLLAHVESPQSVVRESIRVTRPGGQVVFLMPADPGIANQLVKRLVTYPRMRKRGIPVPEYVYALEHRNPIHNLLAHIVEGAAPHQARVAYSPFRVRSWNLNLFLIATINLAAD